MDEIPKKSSKVNVHSAYMPRPELSLQDLRARQKPHDQDLRAGQKPHDQDLRSGQKPHNHRHGDQDLRSGQKPHDQDLRSGQKPHNHAICQKLKAENECFKHSVKQRFGSILKRWTGAPKALKDKIIEIIELILRSEGLKSLENNDKILSEDIHDPQSFRSGMGTWEQSSCLNIKKINDQNKIQFYKINFFIESLEKSKISPIHIHRILIFLQTGIFDHLPIKEFFEQMLSVESLYACTAIKKEVSKGKNVSCEVIAPVDAELSEITKYFYTHITDKCKECYNKEIQNTWIEDPKKRSFLDEDPKKRSFLDPSDSKKKAKDVNENINVLRPLTKMYLCMICGEDNYVNFYERNKSKCRFCILAEKRGLDADAIFGIERTLAPNASKPHHCKYCHTEDPKNFREGYKSTCYACYLAVKRGEKDEVFDEKRDKISKRSNEGTEQSDSLGSEGSHGDPEIRGNLEVRNTSDLRGNSYFCKDCETNLPYKFRRGYKTQCYECFLSAKRREYEFKTQHAQGTLEYKPTANDVNPKIVKSEGIWNPELGAKILFSCKLCNDTNPRNFNEGMRSVCARCEELEAEAYICKQCNLECLRNCFSATELLNEAGNRLCNLCDPVAIASLAAERAKKSHHCEICNETRPEEFYSGFKGKCKACVKEERKYRYRNEVSDRR